MDKKPEEQTQQEVKMPITDKAAVMMDDRSGMVWIGIPVKTTEVLDIIMTLDYVKLQIVNWRKTLIKRPGIIRPMAEGLGKLITGLK